MASECSSLAVTISRLPQMPEHSEMTINTNCFTDLSSSNSAQWVVSSHKIPFSVHWEWTNECTLPIQETAVYRVGALVIGQYELITLKKQC